MVTLRVHSPAILPKFFASPRNLVRSSNPTSILPQALPKMTTETKKITHVLFDMDGLLLNTEDFYTIVQQEIAARFGKKFTWELKSKMMGQKALEAAAIFVKELEINDLTPEQLLIEREIALDAMFPSAQLLPGAERLLRHLHASNIPFALATSSHKRHFDLKTQNHGQVFALFDHITTGCHPSITKGKPDPMIFQFSAQRWDPAPSPECCLVFEDAPSGVAAAKAAGMVCVMVPDPQLDASHHSAADEVLGSLLEFKPEKYGLPPFPSTKE